MRGADVVGGRAVSDGHDRFPLTVDEADRLAGDVIEHFPHGGILSVRGACGAPSLLGGLIKWEASPQVVAGLLSAP